MEIIIPGDKYTLSVTGKTITLADPYDTITVEQIRSIRNLTREVNIYSDVRPRKIRGTAGLDISVSAGVITFYRDFTQAATDAIRITVDVPYVFTVAEAVEEEG